MSIEIPTDYVPTREEVEARIGDLTGAAGRMAQKSLDWSHTAQSKLDKGDRSGAIEANHEAARFAGYATDAENGAKALQDALDRADQAAAEAADGE